MSRITYQTDKWGHDHLDHIEFNFDGSRLVIDVSDNTLLIHCVRELTAKQKASNVIEVKMVKYPADDPDPALADYEQAKRQWSEGWRETE